MPHSDTAIDDSAGNEDLRYRCCEHCRHGKRSRLVENHPQPCCFATCERGNQPTEGEQQ